MSKNAANNLFAAFFNARIRQNLTASVDIIGIQQRSDQIREEISEDARKEGESCAEDHYLEILKTRDELKKAVARGDYDLSSAELSNIVHQINQCAAQLLQSA